MSVIRTIEELEAHYGQPKAPSLVKVADHITPQYRAWIEASPFCALATTGPEGLDCSPRGDRGAVVTVLDPKTLALPDRRGNNRIDSLRNIVRNPETSLMFLVPGSDTVIRVNGQAEISVDEALKTRFSVDGKAPRSIIVLHVREVYFQCARAVMRAGLWNPPADIAHLPTPGDILAAQTNGDVGGRAYDEAWPDRAQKTMW